MRTVIGRAQLLLSLARTQTDRQQGGARARDVRLSLPLQPPPPLVLWQVQSKKNTYWSATCKRRHSTKMLGLALGRSHPQRAAL
jgi:hypothetical protein